jgi:putative ABC transport system permease protein
VSRSARLLPLAWRESRFARRRLLLFLSAITLGVAALVATRSFAANLAAGVREQARELVGADVSLSSTQTFGEGTEALLDSLQRAGARVVRGNSFVSMALLERTGSARLVQVRASEAGWPLYGAIRTAPAGAWEGLHADRNAVVDPALLTALDARVGDVLSLGEARFRITGTAERVPGTVAVASIFAPRIFVPQEFLEETGLLQFGSRIEREAYVRLPNPAAAEALAREYRPVLRAERVSSRTPADQQAELGRAMERLTSFLGLVGTFALLLGGIGVASAMSAYMAQKRETVATLRCLGATAPQVTSVYLLQAGAMGLVGAAIGAALGVSVQFVLPGLLSGLLPVEVQPAVHLPAVAEGIGIGVWVALAFALLPLLATRRVSPLEALRRRVEAPAGRRFDAVNGAAWAALAGSAAAIIVIQAGDARTGAVFAIGIAVALGLLWACAWGATRVVRRMRGAGGRYTVRQGLANLHRPGNQTRVVVLALGFGVFLLATLYLAQGNLLRPLRMADPERTANLLLFDVQDDQAGEAASLVEAGGARLTQRAPIVPMRIHAINGAPVAAVTPTPDAAEPDGAAAAEIDETADTAQAAEAGERRAAGWAVRREYRSTYRDTLVASERVVAGRFWAPDAARNGQVRELSLEEGVARDLGVGLGDTVTWDVQGVRVATQVTSLREVDWQRMEPNFFAVFPTEALAGAPQTWVILARAPDAQTRAELQRDVVRRFPNVVVVDLTAVQAAIEEVLGRVSAVIRFLAGFSLVTGFIVLLGAVLTGRLQRIRESVLLRTLGATRGQIGAVLLTEYVALGLLASLAGIVLASAAGWALARFLFEVEFALPVLPLLGVAALTTLLAAAVGLLASREVFRHTPLEALRDE